MSIYNFEINASTGESIVFEHFKDKAILVVNTATQCGLTPQFDGLEKLHQDYKDKGLQVIGFPCNQFASQEPLSNDQMQESCRINHGVTFPLTEKIDVNGKNAHPIFQFLKKQKGGFLTSAIKWNFTKFLVDRSGKIVKRYAPTTKPEDIEADIQRILD